MQGTSGSQRPPDPQQQQRASEDAAAKTRNALRWIPGEFSRADYPNIAAVLEHL